MVVRYVNGNGGRWGDGGVRGDNKACKYGSDNFDTISPMGIFEALLKVIRTSESCLEVIKGDASKIFWGVVLLKPGNQLFFFNCLELG